MRNIKKWILSLIRRFLKEDEVKPNKQKILYVFASKAHKTTSITVKNQILESVIKNTFELSEIAEIVCYPQTNAVAKNLNCKFINLSIVTPVVLINKFKQPNANVLICWNDSIKDRVIPIIALLMGMRKEFYLLKHCGTSHSLEYFDNSGNYLGYSTKSLGKKVLAILKEKKLKYSLNVATSGTIYIKITDSPLIIRISDHKPIKMDEENKVFNMGLYGGSDGLIPEFKKWLRMEA